MRRALICEPLLQEVSGTAALPLDAVLFTPPFPFVVLAADAAFRGRAARRSSASATVATSASTG